MHFLPISYADFRAYFPSLSLPGWKAFKIPGDGLTIGWETIWYTPTARITTSIPPIPTSFTNKHIMNFPLPHRAMWHETPWLFLFPEKKSWRDGQLQRMLRILS